MAQENNYTDWPAIWASRYRRDLYWLEMTGRGYADIIKKFIKENPGHHYCEHVEKPALNCPGPIGAGRR